MHGLDFLLGQTGQLSSSDFFSSALGLIGYVGLGTGTEFIPYFAALLSFMAAALIAALQWPLSIMLGYLSRARQRRPPPAYRTTDAPSTTLLVEFENLNALDGNWRRTVPAEIAIADVAVVTAVQIAE
jgi:hypothetical protein